MKNISKYSATMKLSRQITNELRVCSKSLRYSLEDQDSAHNWLNLDDLLGDRASNNLSETNSCAIVITIVITKDDIDTCLEAIEKWIKTNPNIKIKMIILSQQSQKKSEFNVSDPDHIYLILPLKTDTDLLLDIVEQAFETMKLKQRELELRSRLSVTNKDIRSLSKVGQLLGEEHNFDKLIRLILKESIKLASSDSGSVYVIERNKENKKPTHLRFKCTALDMKKEEFLLPIDDSSIAGHVALTGKILSIDDVYSLKDTKYSFNRELDIKFNYRTKSMLVVPMKNNKNQIIGIIQLINRKKEPSSEKLAIEDIKGDKVIPFTTKDLEFTNAIAGQAGAAIQNNFLINDIHHLFEGFVTAAITAIEQRDPTTSGHSFRVAQLTVGMAEVVDLINIKPFENIKFSKDQIREIRYAALLHDFGKLGVREQVLLKAKKLYPYELENIEWRYYLLREIIHKQYLEKKIKLLREKEESNEPTLEHTLKEVEQIKNEKLTEIDEMFNQILRANEPSILEEGNFEILEKIKSERIQLHNGEQVPFLKENEFLSLAIKKGSLNVDERKEIESHVVHTYTFLKKIPWTQDLRYVPSIAHGHHEKLDGSGYPLGLGSNDICIQTRMMTISDVYDALTAPDRPYKASLPKERALDILDSEVKEKRIDADLFNLFVRAKVYEFDD